MTPESKEVLEAVIRAAEKTSHGYIVADTKCIGPLIDARLFIQALKDELK